MTKTFNSAKEAREALEVAGFKQQTAVGGKSVMGKWSRGSQTIQVSMSLAKNFRHAQHSLGGGHWVYAARF